MKLFTCHIASTNQHALFPSDAVQEPNVTCKLNKLSRTLFCSVSSQFNVSYEWTGSGSAPQSGQELQISKEEKPDSVYTCTVKNEVSKKSSSFTVKDCDTGTLHACIQSLLKYNVHYEANDYYYALVIIR